MIRGQAVSVSAAWSISHRFLFTAGLDDALPADSKPE